MVNLEKMFTMKPLNTLLFIALLLLNCASEKTAQQNDFPSIFDWMTQNEQVIDLTIRGNLDHLFADKHDTDHFHPAHITIKSGNMEKAIDTRISRRGVTRRKICDFPPIKIKFDKNFLESNQLADFKSYKLVTHCKTGEEEIILKEYLTYKLFNQISESSFRVKLAKVTYVDEKGNLPEGKYFGFLIESNKEIADRLNGKLLDPAKSKITSVHKEQYKKMVVFQYMIGNTDWNLSKGHNIKWIKPKDRETPIPIPYDFDYCGLVNAHYAIPHPQLPINNVRERFLQFRGKDKSELLPVAENILINRAKLIQTIDNFPHLEETTKIDIKQFIESFFAQVEENKFL